MQISAGDGMSRRSVSSDKALSCPKTKFFVVLMSRDEYMYLIADSHTQYVTQSWLSSIYQLQDDASILMY